MVQPGSSFLASNRLLIYRYDTTILVLCFIDIYMYMHLFISVAASLWDQQHYEVLQYPLRCFQRTCKSSIR